MTTENTNTYTRNFGFLISLILFLICFYPMLKGFSINIFLLIMAITTSIISVFSPNLMKKPAHLWREFGKILHKIISPIIMLLVYITSIVLVAFLMKIFRRDGLEKKINKNKKSYWIKREKNIKDSFKLNDQF